MFSQLSPLIAPPRRTRLIVYAVVVTVIGVAVIVWAVPRAWTFFHHAPNEFWVIAALGVLADARPFVLPQVSRWPSRLILSVCFIFAIFLLWDGGPAVVVQVIAVTVAALRMRIMALEWHLMTMRLVIALAAAEATVAWFGRPRAALRAGVDLHEVALVAAPTVVWFVVNFGLLITVRLLVGFAGFRTELVSLRYDYLAAAALLLLAPVVIASPTGWSIALIAVPLLALVQLSRLVARQERRLTVDPATGVLSRRGLVVRFDRFVTVEGLMPARPQRFGLMLITLDGLLYINDSIGRNLAEEAAGAAAARLTAAVGPDDPVGRLSTDTFVVLVPELTAAGALGLASRSASVLSVPAEVEGLPFALEPAVGVALSPEHGRDFSTLVGKAQVAASSARERDERAELFVEESLSVTERRVSMISDLRSALRDPGRHAEIELAYQPQVRLDTGRPAGVEALLRWRRPGEGLVPTDELIHAVEPSEVMHLLTWHVLKAAAAQMRAWNRMGLDLRTAVNVSARDISSEDFAGRLCRLLAEHDVRPSQLVIEITEGTLLSTSPRLVRAVTDLAASGVGLSIDDFGTGFASLQQLRRFPLAEVKIDRSYVGLMTANSTEYAIVRAVYQLARTLGLRVVAEGVEDADTARLLARLPGVIGQGWFFGRPMPPDALPDWLARHAAR